MKKAEKFELKFVKKEKVAKDTYSFYFDRKKTNFDFISGQYLKLFLDIENPDERGSSRYFTISSSPNDPDYLVITTKIIESSFKINIFSLKPGEKINAFGPIGYFDFDIKSKNQNIFIAGGIGMTPYHSILKSLEFSKLNPKITLFVSFKNRDDIIFFNELKEIEKKKTALKIVYSLTNEDKNYPEFEKGRINIDMIKKYVQDYTKADFFLVGSESLVESIFEMLRSGGVLEDRIFKEDFPGY